MQSDAQSLTAFKFLFRWVLLGGKAFVSPVYASNSDGRRVGLEQLLGGPLFES